MWLEPKYSIYGPNYASGRVLLGLTRGNENLVNATDVSKIYDSRRLDFGVRIGTFPNIREIFVSRIREFGPRWTEDFHAYTTIWTSDGFTFLLDGQEVGRVSPDPDGWMHDANVGRKTAPFDQEVISVRINYKYKKIHYILYIAYYYVLRSLYNATFFYEKKNISLMLLPFECGMRYKFTLNITYKRYI